MRLARLNTDLEMWNEERREYVSVPIGTMVHVTKPNEKWMEARAPGGLMLSFPTDYYTGVHLDFLDGGPLDATSDA